MSRRSSRTYEGQAPKIHIDLDPETLESVRAHLDARARRCEHQEVRLTEAWDRFYAACDPLIRRLARRRVGRSSDTDDRVQEVWGRIIGHFNQYDPRRGPFPNWLAICIRNALTDQDRTHHPLGHLDRESEQRLPGRELDPKIAYERIQEQRRVRAAIEILATAISNTNYRIVHARLIEGKTFAEIAPAVGLSMKQVRDRHHRTLNNSASDIGSTARDELRPPSGTIGSWTRPREPSRPSGQPVVAAIPSSGR